MGLGSFIRQWREWQAFNRLTAAQRALVFYSEGGGYLPHLAPILQACLREYGGEVVYLSSQASDPFVQNPPAGVRPFYIGDGTVRTLLFASLKAGVVVMTMPDLQTFYIKRSPHVRHYAYIHHSLVSTHMVYRPEAFDHFDSIFCVGPHHHAETRKREQMLGLKTKQLIAHGYGRLDTLREAVGQSGERPALSEGVKGRVLVAPSWGENGLLERLGYEYLLPLLQAGYQVTLRPHPQTRRLRPEVLAQAEACLSSFQNFALDEDMASKQSLFDADVMVSDWSGAALEFAFGLERPVVFVDVPRKVNNPAYEQLEIEPLEVGIRSRVGRVLPESELERLVDLVDELVAGGIARETFAQERDRWVYHVDNSATVAAQALWQLARQT